MRQRLFLLSLKEKHNMDLFDSAQKIYSPKSREYFKEVISSYVNGNYRSAIVMLYSVCICDLLFKLQELKDMYNDGIAKNIINDIEKHKIASSSKSSWEKELVDSIRSKTALLDLEAYINLSHLYDYRNLSAHPALNGELELISPQKEIVAAYIRAALDTILLKPAIFVKDVISIMTNDLNEKKGYLLQDKNVFKDYVQNKYLDRMSDIMFKKTFQIFWRFAFRSINDDCNKNRPINIHLLGLMYNTRKNIIEAEIANNKDKYEISTEQSINHFIIRFLGDYPPIFQLLSDHTKTHITTITDSGYVFRLLSWFTSDKRTHLQTLISNNSYIFISEESIVKNFVQKYEDDGLIDECLIYLIKVVGKATTYINAGTRIERYIWPFLDKMEFKHFELIFETIEHCDSLKHNQYLGTMYCPRIWEYAKKHLPKDYDMTKYPHFSVPTTDE